MIALASLAANFSTASSIYTKDGTLASVQALQKSSFHFLKRELLTDKDKAGEKSQTGLASPDSFGPDDEERLRLAQIDQYGSAVSGYFFGQGESTEYLDKKKRATDADQEVVDDDEDDDEDAEEVGDTKFNLVSNYGYHQGEATTHYVANNDDEGEVDDEDDDLLRRATKSDQEMIDAAEDNREVMSQNEIAEGASTEDEDESSRLEEGSAEDVEEESSAVPATKKTGIRNAAMPASVKSSSTSTGGSLLNGIPLVSSVLNGGVGGGLI